MSKFRLCIVYNDNDIYAEFSHEDFKKLLMVEYEKLENLSDAFDKTCELLKNELLKT